MHGILRRLQIKKNLVTSIFEVVGRPDRLEGSVRQLSAQQIISLLFRSWYQLGLKTLVPLPELHQAAQRTILSL